MHNNKRISLSITSCKRLDLLRRVLRSFNLFCTDLDIIDDIIFFDDSSNSEEKNEMELIINDLFPNQNKIITHFYEDSFEDGYRHSRILNVWMDKFIENKIDYCFHLEDDWLFVNFFSIKECVDLLENNNEYAYVGLSQSWKKFPENLKPKEIGNYWEWIYLKDRQINENLFLDEVAAVHSLLDNSIPISIWITYINWPNFSLRPGLIDVKKTTEIGKFSIADGFELEFAIRWSEKWKSLCSKNFNVVNLATNPNMSSYKLNESKR